MFVARQMNFNIKKKQTYNNHLRLLQDTYTLFRTAGLEFFLNTRIVVGNKGRKYENVQITSRSALRRGDVCMVITKWTKGHLFIVEKRSRYWD